MKVLDVEAEHFIRLELDRAEGADGGLCRDAHVRTQVHAQIILVLVGARA